jgi:DNA-binding MarR family transcriptional regulator
MIDTKGMDLAKEIDQKTFRSEYQRLTINVLYTGKWLDYRHACFFKQFDVTAQQYNILRILRGAAPNPATVQYLTERMLDKSSNASRLVDKLEEKGLASRTTCPTNKRAVDVAITEAGQALLVKLDDVFKYEDEFASALTEEEARSLNLLLDKLRDVGAVKVEDCS